jgi:hypothetical protein
MEKRAIPVEAGRQGDIGINLECMIRKALADAWARGCDLNTANQHAIVKVLESHPDMTAAEVRSATRIVRQNS